MASLKIKKQNREHVDAIVLLIMRMKATATEA